MTTFNDLTLGPALTLLILLSMTACGGATQEGSPSATPSTGPVSPPATPAVTPTVSPVTPVTLVTPPIAPPVVPTNQAPKISGSPVTSSQTDRPYAFKPAAVDLNGDRLTFSISAKPNWATFDAATGVLSGTPLVGDVGTYRGISISVSDGQAAAALGQFSITVTAAPTRSVTLRWTAPTQNVDGTSLTDLASYIVAYGDTTGAYTTTLDVVDLGSNSVVIEGLAPGTWYFAIKAVNAAGMQSAYSGEVVASL